MPEASRLWLLLCSLMLLDVRQGRALPGDAGERSRPAPVRMTGSSMYALRVPTINTVQTGVLVMDGRPYRIVERETNECSLGLGINARHEPLERLLSEDCLFGPRCLTFEGHAAATGCGPDRLEIDLASDEHSLRFGETGYLRFFLRVDPSVVGPDAHSLITQAWQFASVAIGNRPPLGPAFSIALTHDAQDDARATLRFLYRDTVTRVDLSHEFFEYSIKKGEWRSFQIALTPRYVGHAEGPGSILIWVDEPLDAELVETRAINYDGKNDRSYRFHWGYPPDPETRLLDRFEVRIGIYRPEPLTWLKYSMDGVKLTRSKSDLPGL